MTNIANKDEALRCLGLAKKALQDNDVARARRFAAKAQKLCACDEVTAFMANFDYDDNGAHGPSTSSSSAPERGDGVRHRNGRIPTSERSDSSTATSGSRQSGTQEQQELVRKILKENNFYTILGISKDADEEEIKRAYKKLALKLHPDKNKAPNAEEAFKAVSRAFSCLSDPVKRSNYDRFGHEDRQQLPTHGHQGMHTFYAEDLDPHEIFNMFFRGAFPQTRSNMFHPQHRAHFQRDHAEGGAQSVNFMSLMHVLPLLVLFVYTFLSGPSEPPYKMSRDASFSEQVTTRRFDVPFFVKSRSQFNKAYPAGGYNRIQLEIQIESYYRDWLENRCREEKMRRRRVAHWRGELAAQEIELTHCIQLKEQFRSKRGVR
eukprot:evm.model.scf_398.2 EVM.evm.TU.scf_398.2   scf_398:13503-15625(+)